MVDVLATKIDIKARRTLCFNISAVNSNIFNLQQCNENLSNDNHFYLTCHSIFLRSKEIIVTFAKKSWSGGDDFPGSSVYIVKASEKKMPDREQQFKELFLSEYSRMYKAAYILLGDEDEAKDAVQDVFAKLWAGTSPLREESQRTFLLTCVRNRCLNIIAQRKTEQKALLLLTSETIDSGTHDAEIIRTIEDYIDERLTPQTSRIIKMHFDEEQSYKEISSSLGISLSAVNKHIVQGLRKLRSTFKNREA